LTANIALLIAPGAELVDAGTGETLERWPERQDYAMQVSLLFDVGLGIWRADQLGPPVEFADEVPGDPGPSVRCPGLGADRSDRADPVQGRPWCFGGSNGTLAYDTQVRLFARVPCGLTRASVLTLGWPVGSEADMFDPHEYVRDPDGSFDRTWPLAIRYRANTRLPGDAYSTGLTDGEFEIWVSPAAKAKAIWVRHGSHVERWPRAGEWGVTDCN
jgi:hypothetical protein